LSTEVIVGYLSEVDGFKDRDAAEQALARVLSAIGFDYFALLRPPKPTADLPSFILTGHWPKNWPEIYMKRRFGVIDPTVRYLRKSQEAFRWRDALASFADDPYFSRMQRMMTEARRRGLEDGYIFPVHCDRGLLGYLTVGGRAVDLSPLSMTLMDALAKKSFWTLLRLIYPEFAERLTQPVDVQMTRREMEALTYLTEGMTSNEIGQVLKISSNTVDWYMNGIQDKLKAKNRHHAVALAFRLGLIV